MRFLQLLRKKRFFALLLVAFFILFFSGERWIGQWMYPVHYKQDIQTSALNYEIDPLLIAAIIRVESNYKQGNVSKKGAIGMMQLMPDTATWIIERAGFPQATIELMDRADVNIEIGVVYVRWLSDQFATDLSRLDKLDDMALIASAYNAGPTKVSTWLNEGIWDGTYANLAKVPYGETRHYVQRVIYYYKKYEHHYAGGF